MDTSSEYSTSPSSSEADCGEDGLSPADVMSYVFQHLFTNKGHINTRMLEEVLQQHHHLSMSRLLRIRDVDGYNLLEKVTIYNSSEAVDIVLTKAYRNAKAGVSEHMERYAGHCLHLACFLCCDAITELVVDYNKRLINHIGYPRIRTLMGPKTNRISQLGYDSARITNTHYRLQWIQRRARETPLYYAVCADNLPALQVLCGRRADLTTTDMQRLVGVASACASYRCLRYFTSIDRHALLVRDSSGMALVSMGIGHGSAFIEFLRQSGVAADFLNSLDAENNINALHVFLYSLDKNDYIINKYSEVHKVVKTLLHCGVDINQETKSYKGQGVSDTPLHLIVDQVNTTIQSRGGLFPGDARDMQHCFDDCVIKSVSYLLAAKFRIHRFGESLLQRLFSNRNYLYRFRLAQDDDTFAHRAFGLANVYAVARMLFVAGTRIAPRRKQCTPLLKFIDGLGMSGVRGFHILDHLEAGSLYTDCLQLLLTMGCDPNSYPLYRDAESHYASALIHFLNTLVDQVCLRKVHLPADCYGLTSVQRVLSLLCRHGARLTCLMNVEGSFVKHSAFDCCVQLLQVLEKGKVDPGETLALLDVIVPALVRHGGAGRTCEYAELRLKMTGDAGVRHHLLYQVLLHGAHMRIDVQNTPRFQNVVRILSNVSNCDVLRSIKTIICKVPYA